MARGAVVDIGEEMPFRVGCRTPADAELMDASCPVRDLVGTWVIKLGRHLQQFGNGLFALHKPPS